MYIRALALLVFLLALPTFVFATEPSSSLQVEPVYSENQVLETKGYFDVNANPGELLNLKLHLENTAETPITVRVEKANAYTNPTGGIFYGAENSSEDTKLLDDAVQLIGQIEVEETVTVPANDSIDLPIQVTVPDIDGQTVLGGIKVTQVAEETEEDAEELEEDEASFSVKTETTYAVAIKVNLPVSSKPDFSTGTGGFLPATAQVFLEMTNDAHMIQGDVEGTYAVLDSSGAEVFEGEMILFNMAPKSQIRYPFAWNHETLEDGDYTLVVDGQAGEQLISVEEPFTISTEEVQEYAEVINPTPVVDEDEKGGIPMALWIAIAAVVAVIFGVLMFFMGKRRQQV